MSPIVILLLFGYFLPGVLFQQFPGHLHVHVDGFALFRPLSGGGNLNRLLKAYITDFHAAS